MKWPIIALLVTGIAAAFCAALLVGSLTLGGSRSADLLKGSGEVQVIVATRDLPAMSVVSADAVEKRSVPAGGAPAGALTDPLKAVGQVLTVPVLTGEALTNRAFAAEGTGAELAAKLKPGRRAMTVSLADYAGLEGLLYPGSLVDVVATFQLRGNGIDSQAISTTLLQNIEVLAIEKQTVGSEHVAASSDPKEAKASLKAAVATRSRTRKVTLEVDPQQAEALQLAVEHGVITLSMRNPLDRQEVSADATVLSEGRLAQLADFLKAQVRATDLPTGVEVQPAAAVSVAAAEPASVAVAAPTPRRDWEVQVLRGVKVDTVSFPFPESPDATGVGAVPHTD